MREYIINFIEFLTSSPALYIASVIYTAAVFNWMKRLVIATKEHSEWFYILVVLFNGLVSVLISTLTLTSNTIINPAIIVIGIPTFAVFEFSLISKDTIRTFVFMTSMLMLQLACIFSVSATFVTTAAFGYRTFSNHTMVTATITLTLFLLSISMTLVTTYTKGILPILRSIIHDFSLGALLFIYMTLNGVVLGILTAIDYRVYYAAPGDDSIRAATLVGMMLRYLLILITSIIIVYVQCRVESHRQQAQEFELSANTDPMTSLLNRRGVESMLEKALKNFDKSDTIQGALFILDLDHFKSINDNLGHPMGDALIKRAANDIKSVFRESDFVGRLGGDEFIVYMPGKYGIDLLEAKAKALNEKLQYTYGTPTGLKIHITTSIGVALFPACGTDYKTLYHASDTALYTTKKNGRNNYTIVHSMEEVAGV